MPYDWQHYQWKQCSTARRAATQTLTAKRWRNIKKSLSAFLNTCWQWLKNWFRGAGQSQLSARLGATQTSRHPSILMGIKPPQAYHVRVHLREQFVSQLIFACFLVYLAIGSIWCSPWGIVRLRNHYNLQLWRHKTQSHALLTELYV